MRETEDGFRIAEEDLRCAAKATCSARARAACRASASPASRCTANSIGAARDDAALVLARDPDLEQRRAARRCAMLLYLFERDEAIRLIRAG